MIHCLKNPFKITKKSTLFLGVDSNIFKKYNFMDRVQSQPLNRQFLR